MFYLIDLERSIGSGLTTYWRASERGYTIDLTHAGEYSEEHSAEAVDKDLNMRTVRVPKDEAERIASK